MFGKGGMNRDFSAPAELYYNVARCDYHIHTNREKCIYYCEISYFSHVGHNLSRAGTDRMKICTVLGRGGRGLEQSEETNLSTPRRVFFFIVLFFHDTE